MTIGAGNETAEEKYINERMSMKPPSDQLEKLRGVLTGTEVSPQNAIEFFIPEGERETLFQNIRTATKGACYFFHKVENGQSHVICLYNVSGVAEAFDKMKEQSGLADMVASTASRLDIQQVQAGMADSEVDF